MRLNGASLDFAARAGLKDYLERFGKPDAPREIWFEYARFFASLVEIDPGRSRRSALSYVRYRVCRDMWKHFQFEPNLRWEAVEELPDVAAEDTDDDWRVERRALDGVINDESRRGTTSLPFRLFWELAKECDLSTTKIAARLGVSKQRANQLLTRFVKRVGEKMRARFPESVVGELRTNLKHKKRTR